MTVPPIPSEATAKIAANATTRRAWRERKSAIERPIMPGRETASSGCAQPGCRAREGGGGSPRGKGRLPLVRLLRGFGLERELGCDELGRLGLAPGPLDRESGERPEPDN